MTRESSATNSPTIEAKPRTLHDRDNEQTANQSGRSTVAVLNQTERIYSLKISEVAPHISSALSMT